MQRLNDKTFDQAILSSTPVLITFTAPKRCHNCRLQEPVLEELSHEIPVYVLDVEQPDSQEIERRLGHRGVPFHKIYARGQLLYEHLGLSTRQKLLEIFEAGKDILMQMGQRRSSTVSGMLGGFGR